MNKLVSLGGVVLGMLGLVAAAGCATADAGFPTDQGVAASVAALTDAPNTGGSAAIADAPSEALVIIISIEPVTIVVYPDAVQDEVSTLREALEQFSLEADVCYSLAASNIDSETPTITVDFTGCENMSGTVTITRTASGATITFNPGFSIRGVSITGTIALQRPDGSRLPVITGAPLQLVHGETGMSAALSFSATMQLVAGSTGKPVGVELTGAGSASVTGADGTTGSLTFRLGATELADGAFDAPLFWALPVDPCTNAPSSGSIVARLVTRARVRTTYGLVDSPITVDVLITFRGCPDNARVEVTIAPVTITEAQLIDACVRAGGSRTRCDARIDGGLTIPMNATEQVIEAALRQIIGC